MSVPQASTRPTSLVTDLPMTTQTPPTKNHQPSQAGQSLIGVPGWIITDGKAGMIVQAQGIADALGLQSIAKVVSPTGLWRMGAPWISVNPAEKFGAPGSQFAPPWPRVAIATGRSAIPYIRALKRHAGNETFTVILQDPKTGASSADMIWVPHHDTRRGPNVATTLTAPHSFSEDRLTALRARLPKDIQDLPSPRVAVILGGKNAVYKFTQEDDERFEASLRSLAALGASFLVTPSRRSHQRLIHAADTATASAKRIIWNGEGHNPYAEFLAAADILIVTADSVNMCGEACATGKPVFVFSPSGGSPKFTRFHEGLRAHGATRPLPRKFDAVTTWTYEPLQSAATIAEQIRLRYAQSKT